MSGAQEYLLGPLVTSRIARIRLGARFEFCRVDAIDGI